MEYAHNTISGQMILPGLESFNDSFVDFTRKSLLERREKLHGTRYLLYDELSGKTQERARNWFLTGYPDFNWWRDDTFPQELAALIGFDIDWEKTTWSLEYPNRYYALHASYEYQKGWKSKIQKNWGHDVFTRPESHPSYSPITKFFHDLAAAIDTLERKRLYRIKLTMRPYHHGGQRFSQSVETYDDRRSFPDDVDLETMTAANHLVSVFKEFLLTSLEQEFEYLNSDEHAAEMCKCNFYKFNIDGTVVSH